MQLLYDYQNYLSTYSLTTQKTYFECVKLYLKYLENTKGKVNAIIILNVSKADIYNYIAYMDDLSKNSKKVRIYAIKNFYSYLNLRQDLFEDIKLFNTSKKVPRILSSSQCRLLYDYYTNDRNKLIVYLFLTTGIRLSELANLKVEDVGDDFIICRCKGGVERKVLLNQKCSKMLHDYMIGKEDKIFEIGKRQIEYIITNAMKKLGIERISAYIKAHICINNVPGNQRHKTSTRIFRTQIDTINTNLHTYRQQ